MKSHRSQGQLAKKRRRETLLERLARDEILSRLGRRCVTCGLDDERALQIDHVRGNGAEDRRAMKMKKYFRTIRGKLGTGDYQVLCANCNWIKGTKRVEGDSVESTQMVLVLA